MALPLINAAYLEKLREYFVSGEKGLGKLTDAAEKKEQADAKKPTMNVVGQVQSKHVAGSDHAALLATLQVA